MTTDGASAAAELIGFFGEGEGSPSLGQWRALVEAPDPGPICVVNFVKLRAQARYEAGATDSPCTGTEAFLRYGAGSVPRILAVGGTVVFAGPQERTLIGADEDWDVIVVVTYPDRAALLRLFRDAEYRAAFRHRRAGVERYRAVISASSSRS